MLCCLIANIYRDTDKRREPFEVTEFMLNFETDDDEPDEEINIEAFRMFIENINAAMGGLDLRDGDAR